MTRSSKRCSSAEGTRAWTRTPSGPSVPLQLPRHLVQLVQAAALAVGDQQLDLGQGLGERRLDPLAQLVQPLAGERRDHRRVGMAQFDLVALVVAQQVGLVEDEEARLLPRPDLLQHLVDRVHVEHPSLFGLGGVDDVHDQVGQRRLLERRLERLDQLVGQLLDEADRVGQQVVAAGELEAPRGRVERLEEAVGDADLGPGQRVQQGRLAGVGVAGEGDARDRGAFALGPHHAAVLFGLPEAAAQRRDPVAGEPAVGLDLALARAPGADAAVDAPGAEALEVGPEAPHAGHVVFELGQLDLQLALGRVGVVGEDVEDHRGAVDHRDAERRLQVALLARQQLVVAGDEVGVVGGDLRFQLFQPAAAEVAVGVRFGSLLGREADGGDARGAQQLLQLGQRLAVLAAVDDADRERPLTRPTVVGPAPFPFSAA